MRPAKAFLGVLLGIGSGCGSDLRLNLTIHDPCNQAVLADESLGIAHIEFDLTSPGVSTREGTTWQRQDRSGSLDGLTPVKDATIDLIGRASDAQGNPGAAVAAGSLGPVDLASQTRDDTVELAMVMGKIDTFFRTTDTPQAAAGVARCTDQATERRGHSTTRLEDGRVILIGGERLSSGGTTSTILDSTELYDPRTGIFVAGPTMPWSRKEHTATLLGDGRVFIAGGIGLNGNIEYAWKVALIYDPSTESFTPIPMIEARLGHSATPLADGRVLLAGGTFSGDELDSTEIFDPATRASCAGPTLSSPRAFHGALALSAGAVALVGGVSANQVVGTIEFITAPACNKGSTAVGVHELTTPSNRPLVAAIPGKDAFVVVGGFGSVVTKVEDATGLDSVEVVKLAPNLLQSAVICGSLRLRSRRGAAAMASVGDSFVIVGGVSTGGTVVDSAEVLRFGDLETCTVSNPWTVGKLAVGRAGLALTTLTGGDLLVSGGFGRASGQLVTLGQGEVYVRAR